MTMIRFSSLCAVGRDSLPVGCRNLRVPALLKTKEWVPMGEIAASHPSYKFGDSRGFKIDGILCFNCFASAWPLELRQFGSFKCHVGAGLPSGCLAVDRAVDRAIATKIRISLHSRSRLSPTGDQMLPGRPSVSENSLAGSWTWHLPPTIHEANAHAHMPQWTTMKWRLQVPTALYAS